MFKDRDKVCSPKVEGNYNICSHNCLQNALGGVDRCFERTGVLDVCLPRNNDALKRCEDECRAQYLTEPQTQTPVTATTLLTTAQPPTVPTDATD